MNSKSKTQAKITIIILLQISLIVVSAIIITYAESNTTLIGNSINVVGNIGFLSEHVVTEIQKYSLGDNFEGTPTLALSNLKDHIYSIKIGGFIKNLELEPLPLKFHSEWEDLRKSFQKYSLFTRELSIIHDSGNIVTSKQIHKLEFIGDELRNNASILTNSLSKHSQNESLVIVQTQIVLAAINIVIHIFLIFQIVNSLKKYYEDKLQLEIQLALSEEKLESKQKAINFEKLTIIGQLSARISHDIRNPLSIIQVSIENLKLLYKKDFEKIHQIEKIERSVYRIAHQINEVLDFIRSTPMKNEKFSLLLLLRQVIHNQMVPNTIEINYPKTDYFMMGDVTKMGAVFSNLIFNAIQAIKNNGQIDIEISENDREIIIIVIDSGLGIPDKHIEKIFDPLFTTKQSGTGLGLVSVKNIVEQHNGTITAKNNPTSFTMVFPKL